MKRDNKALYEKIMRNVSKQVKRSLNENDGFAVSYDPVSTGAVVEKVEGIRYILYNKNYLNLTNENRQTPFFDENNDMRPQVCDILDTYGDYIENVIYVLIDQRDYRNDELAGRKIVNMAETEYSRFNIDPHSVLEALDKISEYLMSYYTSQRYGRHKSVNEAYYPQTERSDWDKMKYYYSKGSKPERLINSIQNPQKLVNRWYVALRRGYTEYAEAFEAEIRKRALMSSAYIEKYKKDAASLPVKT